MTKEQLLEIAKSQHIAGYVEACLNNHIEFFGLTYTELNNFLMMASKNVTVYSNKELVRRGK
jgi:hypothetical protein